ncbi:DUF4214 domain-containing protein [Rhabdaerophilum sp. SD176]|uniref:DUF4214 domain-containing protein n=1 Tax=Rhabdaerophilum sp. SD176 TaxID=2983548 RepID=UPI0024DF9351|nr:DUF4214 domain-containing protein [Rhabdaerophilum sp. SD176]
MAGLNDSFGVSNDTFFEAEYLGSLGYTGSGASHLNFFRSFDIGPDAFGVSDVVDWYSFGTVGLTQIKIDIHPFAITQGASNYQAGLAYKIVAGADVRSVLMLSDGGNQDGKLSILLGDPAVSGYNAVFYEDFLFNPEFDDHLVIDIAPGTEVYLEVSSFGREVWDSEGTDLVGYEPLTYVLDIFPRSGSSDGGGTGGGTGGAPSTAGDDTADWLAITGNYDGGAGIDTVSFLNEIAPFNALWSGNNANWQITLENGVIVINGYHRLSNVERLEFSDGTLALDTLGNAGQVYRLYQAAFARTPDSAGLKHNVGLVDGELSLQQMSAAFLVSAEFQQKYGTNVSDTAYINSLYRNVLGRDADQGGLDGWQARLNDGSWTRTTLLIGFSESPENIANVAPAIANGIWLA